MKARSVNIALIVVIFLLLVAMIIASRVIVSGFGQQSVTLSALKASDQSLNNQISNLNNARANIAKYGALSELTKTIVPQDKDQAEAIREIVQLAAKNGVAIGRLAYPQSTLGTPGAKPSSKVNLSQLSAVKEMPGVYQLLIEVDSDPKAPVTFNQLVGFLQSLEGNRRTSQVSNVKLVPSSNQQGKLSFSLTVIEYIKP